MKRKSLEHAHPAATSAGQWRNPVSRTLGPQHGFYVGKHVCRGELYWFVSLDGKWWVESDGDPRELTRVDVELLFEPGFWRPLRMATSYITCRGPLEIFEPNQPLQISEARA